MKHLLSPEGKRLLASLSFTRTLYAFDFDGTLAPIVPDPAAAAIDHASRQLLETLAKRAAVAVVSGRSLSDLSRRTPGGHVLRVGNHGAEGIENGADFRTITSAWVRALSKAVRREKGALLEDKEQTLTLHYRGCPDRSAAKKRLEGLARALDPEPRIMLGKCVLNLLPPSSPHKGAALLSLLAKSGCGSALYVGDDDTDEDVFRLGHPRIFSVRVGKKSGSSAAYYLKSRTEMRELLRLLVHQEALPRDSEKE